MNILKIVREKYFVLKILWILLLISTFLLYKENVLRSVVLSLSLLVWGYLFIYKQYSVGASLFFILFIAQFNITFVMLNNACYHNGVYVNYLCPTLHIVDLFVGLSILKTFCEYKVVDIRKSFLFILPLLIYSLLHILVFKNLNTLIVSVRFLMVIWLVWVSTPISKNFDQKKVGLGLIGILFIQFLIALLQFLLRRDLNLQFLGESQITLGSINSSFLSLSFGQYLRGYGTFPHPNVLAGYALAVLAFTFKYIRQPKLNLTAISILSFLIVLLSLSRVSILLYLFLLFVYFLKGISQKTFSVIPIFLERFSISLKDSSVIDRLGLMKSSFSIIKSNPFFGVGNGNFVSKLQNISTVSGISLYQPVHNIFLLLLSEQGILGFIIYLYYLVKLVIRNNREKLSLFVTFTMVLGIGMFDHYLITLPQGLIVLFLFII